MMRANLHAAFLCFTLLFGIGVVSCSVIAPRPSKPAVRIVSPLQGAQVSPGKEISGAAPPEHFIGGYAGAVSERQPPMYFRLGGGTVKGISKPGEIVWSRIFGDNLVLKADLGRAKVVSLPLEETERRWRITTPQWPVMHAVTYGITRDQMMARHKANHIQVAYAPNAEAASLALAAKAAAFRHMGLQVSVCGTENGL